MEETKEVKKFKINYIDLFLTLLLVANLVLMLTKYFSLKQYFNVGIRFYGIQVVPNFPIIIGAIVANVILIAYLFYRTLKTDMSESKINIVIDLILICSLLAITVIVPTYEVTKYENGLKHYETDIYEIELK
jgi:hypothetical protein